MEAIFRQSPPSSFEEGKYEEHTHIFKDMEGCFDKSPPPLRPQGGGCAELTQDMEPFNFLP